MKRSEKKMQTIVTLSYVTFPFEGGNPLAVARKIVEGTYLPLRQTKSALLTEVVTKLLSVEPRLRPDIDEVSVHGGHQHLESGRGGGDGFGDMETSLLVLGPQLIDVHLIRDSEKLSR